VKVPGLILLILLVTAVHAADGPVVRVGFIAPSTSGRTSVHAALYDLVGDAARSGALLAEDDLANRAESGAPRFDVLFANAPSADAARRAAERLIRVEGVQALVGGLGEGQAEVLSAVAERHGVLFLNIGSSDLTLRSACARFTFHVEASAAMYLDGLVMWNAKQGLRRWFVVYEAGPEGSLRFERAVAAVATHGGGGTVVGSAVVVPEQPVYQREIRQAETAGADVILLLADALDQIGFLGQIDSFRSDLAVAPYPAAVTQSREYLAAAFDLAGPPAAAAARVALWETTLVEGSSGQLNERFTSRFARPMDPHGWAAYEAISILHQVAAATGSLESASASEYLIKGTTTFSSAKGTALSFRSWDHQLRQPLYVVRYEPDARWGMTVSQRIAVASLAAQLPESSPGIPLDTMALDTLGGAPVGGCR
jgi:ABC-type branched-subunit amino acid transport system substrate-binding protein